MKFTNLHGFKSLNPFIKFKMKLLESSEASFDSLFNLMFLEGENIMYEESVGFRIRKVTYEQAKKEATNYAYIIKSKLAYKAYDSVVGIYLDNSDRWIEIFWAVLMAGFKPLLLNKRLDTKTLNNSIKSLKVNLVITDEDIKFDTLTININNLDVMIQNVSLDKFGTEILLMSSGTTSNIKICAYTAEEFKYILLQSKDIIRSSPLIKKHYKGELKLLAFLPFYHIFGLVAVYTWFAFYSRTFVGIKDLSPSTIQNTIKRHHVTHIFAVPLLWQKTYESAIREIKNEGSKTYNKFLKGMKISKKLMNVPLLGNLFRKVAFKQVREKMFGQSVYFMIAGGSFIDERVLSFFNLIGYHLANGYGMTEVGITSVELSTNFKSLISGSIGKPLTHVSYRIDENENLLINSKAMAAYIIENKNKVLNKNIWLNSHDLARFDGRNYYILGRHDDLIVPLNGENINPNIIESKLYIEGIQGLCLIQNPDTKQAILLVSINKNSSEERIDSIKASIKQSVIDNNLGEQINKIDYTNNPLMNEGDIKLNRQRITQEYFEGKFNLINSNNNQDNNEQTILSLRRLIAKCLNVSLDEVNENGDFFLDLGGSSFDYYLVSSEIEKAYGVSLVSSSVKLRTVKEINDYIKKIL